MATKLYGVFDGPATDYPPEGHERVSLVTEDATGEGYFQVEAEDGTFYLCDADGEKVELANWTLERVLADIPADDPDAFSEAIGASASRTENAG